MHSLSPVIRAIRTDLAAAARSSKRVVELDIDARRHDAAAGRRWAAARTRIRTECDARGISEAQWCKKHLECHISTMLLRVQLAKNWTDYETRRRAEGDNGQCGLRHALALIPVNRRYGAGRVSSGGGPKAATISSVRRGCCARRTSGKLPQIELSRYQLATSDALTALRGMKSGSVQCNDRVGIAPAGRIVDYDCCAFCGKCFRDPLSDFGVAVCGIGGS